MKYVILSFKFQLLSGMCSMQWSESVVTGTADAFDFYSVENANNEFNNAQVSLKIFLKNSSKG